MTFASQDFMRLYRSILSTGRAGRIVRNILFWLLFTAWHVSGRNRLWPDYPALLAVIIMSFAPSGYAHNLWLIPRFLLRRRYVLYTLLTTALICITCAVSYYLTHTINRLVPGLEYMGDSKDVAMCYHAFPTIFVLAMLTFGKFTADAIRNQRKLEHAEKRHLESELHSLRAQVNPHFLFNALNTIYGMARRADAETAQAVMQLSGILRHNLYDCEEPKIDLAREILFLEQYVAFARLRLHERERISMQIEGEAHGLQIVPLLLAPFVENAIKHGLSQHSYHSWAEVSLRIEGENLYFNCRNSFHTKALGQHSDEGKGIGLKNVRRRLELLYPKRHQLNISDASGVFHVALILQLS